MSRGVSNVLVEDCTFVNSDVGVRIKSALGRGGIVENIEIRRVNMLNIKEEAVILNMDYVHNIMDYVVEDEKTGNDEDIPVFRDIRIIDCQCIGAKKSVVVKDLKAHKPTIYDVKVEGCNFVDYEGSQLSRD